MNADHAKFLAEVIGQQLQTEWMTTCKVISAVPVPAIYGASFDHKMGE